MTWKTVTNAAKRRIKDFVKGAKNTAASSGKMIGGAMIGGLIGTDLASARAEAKAKEVGEHMRAKIAEAMEQSKTNNKTTDTWKQAAGRVSKRETVE